MLADVLSIEHEENQADALDQEYQARRAAFNDTIAARRQALADRMAAEGTQAAMKQPGDPVVVIQWEGRLHVLPVKYLSAPAPAAPEPAHAEAVAPSMPAAQ
jgi:hypothetical protein